MKYSLKALPALFVFTEVSAACIQSNKLSDAFCDDVSKKADTDPIAVGYHFNYGD